MNDKWIKSEDELPPCDGSYEICHNPNSGCVWIAIYDGYGFLIEHAYRPVQYWRQIKILNKKYGKQK